MALDDVVPTQEEDLNIETPEEEEVDESVDDSDTPADDKDESTTGVMSDDEFLEYINSGKLPKEKLEDLGEVSKEEKSVDTSKARVISKPESTESSTKKDTKSETTEVAPDYEKVYKDIFKAFKANGKEITPKTAEDVISLMQMGANYTKKMQLMAPMKKAVDSLDRAKIGEEELNFLIDVHNGDKEAIKKLLSKHKVDPMDLDLESTDYKPKRNIVSDEDVNYSLMLDDIQSSIPKITEIMNKIWDKESKNALLKDPKLMRGLHEEIEIGRFDEVQNRLELEKTFGRYRNVTDLQAYVDIVQKMDKEASNPVLSFTKETKVESKPSKAIPDKSKAAPTKSKPTSQGTTLSARDILNMPEEEFEKLSIRNLV